MKRIRGIIERLQKNIDEFLTETDDNRTVFDKTVLDMKKGLAEAKELVATAIAEASRLKKAHRDILDAMNKSEKKIERAWHNPKNDIAEKASQQKQRYQERATQLQQQIAAQEEIVAHLKAGLHEFYEKFQSILKKEESLRNRQKQAQTLLQCYEILSRFGTDDENNLLRRVERSVEKLEAHVEKAKSNQNMFTDTQAQQEEENPVRKGNVDDALEKLKKDVFRN